ncbi:mevalonate kinase [Nitrincola sp. MINF-07-Sa-05]|uniref:mevalonate kinase n=1 Tax=Nitrincola salilacus TaxID=3400273 RepID=UPI003917E998
MSVTSVIRVSAPGSVMLMGEHAVLHGHLAIACAVNKYIHLQLTPRTDDQVVIDTALGSYSGSLSRLMSPVESSTSSEEQRLSFVLAVVRHWATDLPSGFELTIVSEFSHQVGLGSSAAVTAALTVALSEFSQQRLSLEERFDAALAVVHQVQQGRGSGTDLAASLQGGLIAYRTEPRQITALPGVPPIALWYAGYKMKTPDVLAYVETRSEQQPALYQALYTLMNQTAEAAEQAIRCEAWPQLGHLMNIYQGLLDALGVNDATLSDMIYRLRADKQVLGAKISGSGLGDCVITLGRASVDIPYQAIPVGISPTGTEVSYEQA